MVLLDRDRRTLEMAKRRLQRELDCEMHFFHGRFSQVAELVKEIETEGFNLILADLGIGTHQLDDLSRGFSYNSTGKLDMRFDDSGGQTAWDVVNHTPEKELADIFYQLGEERYSRQIAAEIIRCREKHSIDSPAELAEIAKKVYARRQSGRTWQKHPATRIFQALRIYVNQEMEELDMMLKLIPDLLLPDGRLGIITYHSLEARAVKQAWKKQGKADILEILTPTPLFPSEEETGRNPRARSAQLRVARKRVIGSDKDNIEN
jgi:16S rRNA (cytosine1402-N4)-methyltransferase